MRAAFTIASLLVVLFIVMKLIGKQAEALKPAAQASAPSQAAAVADQIRQAVEAGAAARASDALGQ